MNRYSVPIRWWDANVERAVRALDRLYPRAHPLPPYMRDPAVVTYNGRSLAWDHTKGPRKNWRDSGVPLTGGARMSNLPSCYVAVDAAAAYTWDWSGLVGLPIHFSDGGRPGDSCVLFPSAVCSLVDILRTDSTIKTRVTAIRRQGGRIPVGELRNVPEELYWRARETYEIGGAEATVALLAASEPLRRSWFFVNP